jgi:hypothetical protein
MITSHEFVAVDPLALIFRGDIYAKIIVNLKHPHEPKVAVIQEAAHALSKDERAAALARARSMMAYAKAAEEALSALK